MEESTIDRKSSIENEPRTLNMDQMQLAREAALYVVNTRGIEDALRIFTEGLEAVVNIGEQQKRRANMEMEIEMGEEIDYMEMVHQLRIGGPRDIASAPF